MRKNSAPVVAAMYFLALGLTLLFWVAQDPATWTPSQNVPLYERLVIGLWSACGPVAWHMDVTGFESAAYVVGSFLVVWSVWLSVVCLTRLRRIPYVLHLVLGFLWCFAGCGQTGLLIT